MAPQALNIRSREAQLIKVNLPGGKTGEGQTRTNEGMPSRRTIDVSPAY
jgi:hypothetical protein